MTKQSKELKVLLKRLRLYRRQPSKPNKQHKVMNLGLQKHVISKMLEKKEISTDLVDLHSLMDNQLTLSENIAVISEAVHTSLGVEHYPSQKEILKEQADMWTMFMRENHLTHYVAYQREGKTISDEVGEPMPRFLLLEYLKTN